MIWLALQRCNMREVIVGDKPTHETSGPMRGTPYDAVIGPFATRREAVKAARTASRRELLSKGNG